MHTLMAVLIAGGPVASIGISSFLRAFQASLAAYVRGSWLAVTLMKLACTKNSLGAVVHQLVV